MGDKSSYSSNNKPQISKGLQDFINAMVEEIVLKGEAFDERKKKWLKKYSEAEGLDFEELEGNLRDFFELLPEYITTNSLAVKRITEEKAKSCFIGNDIIEEIAVIESKEKLITEQKSKEEGQKRKNYEDERLKQEKLKNEQPERKKIEELAKNKELSAKKKKMKHLLAFLLFTFLGALFMFSDLMFLGGVCWVVAALLLFSFAFFSEILYGS